MQITYRTAVRNIRNLLVGIPETDRLESQNWYLRAHFEIKAITATFPNYRIPEEAQFHIVAALSPGCQWKRNLTDYSGALLYWPRISRADFCPQTYPAQRDKALEILTRAVTGGDWSAVLKGPKERAFAQNLAYPEAERELTLDFHAYSIAANVRWTHETVPKFGVATRVAVDRAYRTVAAENNLKACQLQAITWEWWRKTRPAPRFQKTKGKVIAA